jgi:hypothetical protein
MINRNLHLLLLIVNRSPSLLDDAGSKAFPESKIIKAPACWGFCDFVWLTSVCCLRFGVCAGSRSSGHVFAPGTLDAGRFAPEVAEVIEPRAADFAFADHFDRADSGRM